MDNILLLERIEEAKTAVFQKPEETMPEKLAFVEAKTEIKAVRGIGYELRCDDV